jgi:hypothetical protein
MNETITSVGGRCCRLGEKRAGLAQDLVGPAQLTVLSLTLLDPQPLGRTWPVALAQIALGMAHPAAQRLRRAADLACHRLDRRPLRCVLVLIVQDQPQCALSHLG